MGLGYGDAQARHVVPELRRGGGGIGWISRDFLENIKIKKFFLRFREEIQAFPIILLANFPEPY